MTKARQSPDLLVYLHGEQIADITRSGKNGGRLLYQPGSSAISTSMPTTRSRYTMTTVSPWLENLLPDRPPLLQRMRREFRISDEHPVSLLRYIGEEVAGAAQFIRPERLEQALAPGSLVPLTESEIASRLRLSLAEQPDLGESAQTGRFSLAGAQAKIALHLTESGWHEPTGRIPTTHIIKPTVPGVLDQATGEHMALAAATLLGLSAATSNLGQVEEIPVIIVERYDRVQTEAGWVRVHQEDMCQALGVRPMRKYQYQGGPNPLQIADHIRAVTGSFGDEDVKRFVEALIFNWLTLGTDAHAKNYSLLLAPGQARLAPLYDLNSVLPLGRTQAAMSMRIGTTERAEKVTRDDWDRLAVEVGVELEWLLTELERQAAALPFALEVVADNLISGGVGGTMPRRFIDGVEAWLPNVRRTIRI